MYRCIYMVKFSLKFVSKHKFGAIYTCCQTCLMVLSNIRMKFDIGVQTVKFVFETSTLVKFKVNLSVNTP